MPEYSSSAGPLTEIRSAIHECPPPSLREKCRNFVSPARLRWGCSSDVIGQLNWRLFPFLALAVITWATHPIRRLRFAFVQESVDNGIAFYDNCWEYRRGKTELWVDAGLKGRRDKVFLMTKTCPHGRDASLALQMLEESLRRLQTDHLDLWEVHGMAFENDPDLFIRPDGAAEALAKAKKDGKARFVGFTGHQNPMVHLGMLNTGFPFDSVQMPLNAFDHSFTRSFERQVLPELNRRGIAVLAMKPLSGHGEPIKAGALTVEEAL